MLDIVAFGVFRVSEVLSPFLLILAVIFVESQKGLPGRDGDDSKLHALAW